MKYLIGISIHGQAASYILRKRHDVAERFDVWAAENGQAPPHLTLKYHFHATDVQIEALQAILNAFARAHAPIEYKFEEIGFFRDPYAVFLKPEVPPEMRQCHEDLLKSLKTLSWITWERQDTSNMNYHATIARTDFGEEKLESILSYARKDIFTGTCLFDNVSLFRRDDDHVLRLVQEFSFHG